MQAIGTVMERELPEFIDDATFKWPTAAWLLTAFSALIAAFLLLVPDATRLSLSVRATLCILLLIVPVILFASRHGFRLLCIFIARGHQYPELHSAMANLQNERDRAFAVVTALINERQNARALRISYCYYYESTPIIALKRKQGLRAKVGDILTVVDRETGRPLGKFRISDDGGDHYLAKGAEDIDPLWLGYIVQSGNTHSAPPPDALAILLDSTGDE